MKLLTIMAVVLISSSIAEARPQIVDSPSLPSERAVASENAYFNPYREGRINRHSGRRHAKHGRGHRYSRVHLKRSPSSSLAGIVAPLAAKVRSIQATCGSSVISAVRHTYVAGTHTMSLHASGRAVDIQGNPSCIYGQLKGWASSGGGYSNDYHRVNHVHISYGGREAGRVFAHGGGGRRYARHHHNSRYARRQTRHRYAIAQ